MPMCVPTHMILLRYESKHGIIWHRDNDPNDGYNDNPIVTFSFGNSCTFCYLDGREKVPVSLGSGDVVLFGGPSRMVDHCVSEIQLGTSPSFLKLENEIRYVFAFRNSPNMFGHEKDFQFNY